MTDRFDAAALRRTGEAVFAAAGLDRPIAAAVADILVEADLLGYTTHGLQFVPAYLREIEAGRMTRRGEPEVLRDTGSTLFLDGGHLPGQWIVVRAVERALELVAGGSPMVAVAVRRSRNISCLAAYLGRVTERGLFGLLTTSTPGSPIVAPYGGRDAVYSTDPIGIGIPTDGAPILIDTSMSATTNRMAERVAAAGSHFDHKVLVGPDGAPSDDPTVLFTDPRGAIMPMGGLEQGYKGFAFGLMVEALTGGMTGDGHAAESGEAGSNLFLLVIDPDAFGGRTAFARETGWIAAACRASRPRAGFDAVRLPGDRAQAARERQLRDGVDLAPVVLDPFLAALERYGIAPPVSLDRTA